MRYIYFLLLFVLVTSCAHGRLRLKKVDKEDRIELADNKKSKERSSTLRKNQTVIEPSASEELEEVAVSSEAVAENTSITTFDTPETEESESVESTADEVSDGPSKQQKLQLALIAERDAQQAKSSFLWALIMLVLFFIPFVPLFSIVPFIIGSIKLSQSNRSDYITPEGERDARSARVMQIVYAALVILSLLFFTALIVLIF